MSQTANIMRFKCLVCNGKGELPNPDFEACGFLSEEDCLRLFDCKPGDCVFCNNAERCSAGEMELCSNCYGSRFMELDLDKWKYAPNQSLTQEEKKCRGCGNWFPTDHTKDGMCGECWDQWHYEELLYNQSQNEA